MPHPRQGRSLRIVRGADIDNREFEAHVIRRIKAGLSLDHRNSSVQRSGFSDRTPQSTLEPRGIDQSENFYILPDVECRTVRIQDLRKPDTGLSSGQRAEINFLSCMHPSLRWKEIRRFLQFYGFFYV